jgi:N4-gp56 family major capsid protein
MAISNFVPEIWAGQILSALNHSLVFAAPGVVNRNYEGQLQAAGDTVKITAVNAPTIATYTKDSTVISPATLTDTTQSLVITESEYFAFEIDDIDYRQSVSGGALLADAASQAGFALADSADVFTSALVATGTLAGNKTAATEIATSEVAVQTLIDLMVTLDGTNTPKQGRYVVVPSWFHALLVASPVFLDASQSNDGGTLRNGTVGRAFGFDVLVSQNTVSSDSGDDNTIQAGHPSAVSFAQNIASVEAYRPEASFSDALKGLSVYGAKVIRPANLASVVASQSAV